MKNNFFKGLATGIIIIGIFFFNNYVNAITVTSLFISPVTVNPGEKVEVDLYAGSFYDGDNISISMKSTTSNDTFIAYLCDIKEATLNINNKAYFIVPDSVKRGEKYELKYVNVFKKGGSAKIYATEQGTEHYYMNVGSQKYITISNSDINDIELKTFSLKNDTVKLEDKIYVNIAYNGYVDWISFGLTHKETGQILLRTIRNTKSDVSNDWTKDAYFLLTGGSPSGIIGEYDITGINLCVTNSGCKFYKNTDVDGDNYTKFNIRDTLKVVDENYNKVNLSKLSFYKDNVNIGDEVSVLIDSSSDLDVALLSFYNTSNNQMMSVYVKSLNSNPYFVIPTTATVGSYELQHVILTDKKGTSTYYRKGDNDLTVDFNQVIQVSAKEVDTSAMNFNNDNYNLDIIENIKMLNQDAIITVVADNNTILEKSLFEVIAGTRRTLIVEYKDSEWIFNGTDVINPKSIDVKILIESVSNDKYYNELINKKLPDDSFILTFSDNGQLPGKVLIRLKSNELDNIFTDEEMFVYYYDEDSDSLLKVALEIQKTNGYYEFYIHHNSMYILTKEAIKEDYINEDSSLLKLNQDVSESIAKEENKKQYSNIIMIISGILISVVIVLLISILKNKKRING